MENRGNDEKKAEAAEMQKGFNELLKIQIYFCETLKNHCLRLLKQMLKKFVQNGTRLKIKLITNRAYEYRQKILALNLEIELGR